MFLVCPTCVGEAGPDGRICGLCPSLHHRSGCPCRTRKSPSRPRWLHHRHGAAHTLRPQPPQRVCSSATKTQSSQSRGGSAAATKRLTGGGYCAVWSEPDRSAPGGPLARSLFLRSAFHRLSARRSHKRRPEASTRTCSVWDVGR